MYTVNVNGIIEYDFISIESKTIVFIGDINTIKSDVIHNAQDYNLIIIKKKEKQIK